VLFFHFFGVCKNGVAELHHFCAAPAPGEICMHFFGFGGSGSDFILWQVKILLCTKIVVISVERALKLFVLCDFFFKYPWWTSSFEPEPELHHNAVPASFLCLKCGSLWHWLRNTC
jgi:hypothetical protein